MLIVEINKKQNLDKALKVLKGKVIKTGAFRAVMRTYCQQEGRKERCRLGQKGRMNLSF